MWRGSSLTEFPVIRWLGGEGGGDPIGIAKGVAAMLPNISRSDGVSIDREDDAGECLCGNTAL